MSEKVDNETITIADIKAALNEVINGKGDKWEEDRAKALEAQNAPSYTRQPTVGMGAQASANKSEFSDETKFGRFIRYMAHAGNNAYIARDLAHNAGDKCVADMISGKAMGEELISTGGAMVAPTFNEELISGLKSQSVFLEAGPQIVPMPFGNYSQAYADAGPTSYFQTEESANVNDSTITTGRLQMHAKTQVTIVPVSNQLLADTTGRADAQIQFEAERAMGERRDLACLRDDGTQGTVVGMKNLITSASQNFNAGTYSTAQVIADLTACIGEPEDSNVPHSNPHWFFHPRTKRRLMSTITSNGLPVFPEMGQGMLMGAPFSQTTQIPINLNGLGGSDESEVYYIHMGGVKFGRTGQIEVAVVPYASYYSATAAAVVSGLSRLETVVLVVDRWDMGDSYRGKSGGLIEQVRWGA